MSSATVISSTEDSEPAHDAETFLQLIQPWLPVLIGLASILLLGSIAFLIVRIQHRSRHGIYALLNQDVKLPRSMQTLRTLQAEDVRDLALLNCSFFLRASGRYSLVDHLPCLGRRKCKHWFWVRDKETNSDHLLTMLGKSAQLLQPFPQASVDELMSLIQHPYVMAIRTVDGSGARDCVSVVTPLCPSGSLKDIIHGCNFYGNYLDKYLFRGRKLPVPLIQTYGRQILEGLVYLRDLGFPAMSHLHSGNVMVRDSICRLTGHEMFVLGLDSKLQPLLKKKKQRRRAMEALCFGHLLFEMAAGFELDAAHPKPTHLAEVDDPQLAQVMRFIFDNPVGYPSTLQILQLDFFQSVHLRELEHFQGPSQVPQRIKTLLKGMRKKQREKVGKSASHTPPLQTFEVEMQPKESQTGRSLPNPSLESSEMSERRKLSSAQLSAMPATQAPPPVKRKKPTIPLMKRGVTLPRAPPTVVQATSSPPRPEDSSTIPSPPSPVDLSSFVPPVGVAGQMSARAGLLAQIRQGTSLRKVQTSDRSHPHV